MIQTGISALTEAVEQAVTTLDFEQVRRDYWGQNEFVVIERFLPQTIVEESLIPKAEHLKAHLNRNYIPGHKKGGSVSYYTVLEQAPELGEIGAGTNEIRQLLIARELLGMR